MLKTIKVTLDENLLDQIERATRTLPRPTLSELEQQHRAGYLRQPVQPGEFDVWEQQAPR
jgi:hypothetical protein